LIISSSYFDLPVSAAKTKRKVIENNYHLLVYGLLWASKDKVKLTSNQQSGFGRYDIGIEMEDTIFILENKAADDTQDLIAVAQEAVKQAVDKQYGREFNKTTIVVGLAFRGRRLAVSATERAIGS
jgi:hypothetical protein